MSLIFRAAISLLAGAALLLGAACQPPARAERSLPAVGFYHWQQSWDSTAAQHCLLAAYPTTAVHIKVFDVVWSNNRPEPRAQLSIKGAALPQKLAAVVFVTNEVFAAARSEQRAALAQDILDELKIRLQAHSYQALQIDCDWNSGTRAAYFAFLRSLKALLPSDIELSATVRLHQFRRPKEQGVPPVDRGLLMAYNVGDLDDWNSSNTILDTLITAQYLRPQAKAYPLPLDVALPYYEWGVLYREQRLTLLNNGLTAATLAADPQKFQALGKNRFRVLQSTYFEGQYWYQNDLIRLETAELAALITLARQLRVVPSFAGQRLLFYQLGSGRAAACRIHEPLMLAQIFSGN